MVLSAGCIGSSSPGVPGGQSRIASYESPSMTPINIPLEDRENWTVYVINGESVREYSIYELAKMPMEKMLDKDLSVGKTLHWKGVLVQRLGEGNIVNFISSDRYMVSIPYGTKMILALYVDEKPIEDTPVRLIVDLSYGCRCNWIKNIRIVEFVNRSDCFSVYGEVINVLYFSPRTLNIFRGVDAVVKNESNSASLKEILDQAVLKETAKKIVFVTAEGRKAYLLNDVLSKNPTIVFKEGKFKIPGLGIDDLKGIKVER